MKPPAAPAAATPIPSRIPQKLWVVFRPGERHLVVKEPLEGIGAWAKGTDATVGEYQLTGVVHTPAPKKKAASK